MSIPRGNAGLGKGTEDSRSGELWRVKGQLCLVQRIDALIGKSDSGAFWRLGRVLWATWDGQMGIIVGNWARMCLWRRKVNVAVLFEMVCWRKRIEVVNLARKKVRKLKELPWKEGGLDRWMRWMKMSATECYWKESMRKFTRRA